MTHEQRKQQIIEILKEADTETGCIFRIDYEYTASEIATKQEEEMKRLLIAFASWWNEHTYKSALGEIHTYSLISDADIDQFIKEHEK